MQELFNLRHASARNVIERLFRVLKQRFRILLYSPSYSLEIQARIPAALAAIHNFILEYDPDEGPVPDSEVPDNLADDNSGVQIYSVSEDDAQQSSDGANERRDRIAQEMWDSYQEILAERRLHQDGEESEESDGCDLDILSD